MNVPILIASGAWILLTAGLISRHRPTTHRVLIVIAIVTDVALVLHLQVTRGAIQQALSFERAALQQAHIAVSTLALLLYFPLLWFLTRPLHGSAITTTHPRYARLLPLVYGLRTLGFLLMFSMLPY
jgi:Kef-type K+ transport system membrane component KefB